MKFVDDDDDDDEYQIPNNVHSRNWGVSMHYMRADWEG